MLARALTAQLVLLPQKEVAVHIEDLQLAAQVLGGPYGSDSPVGC